MLPGPSSPGPPAVCSNDLRSLQIVSSARSFALKSFRKEILNILKIYLKIYWNLLEFSYKNTVATLNKSQFTSWFREDSFIDFIWRNVPDVPGTFLPEPYPPPPLEKRQALCVQGKSLRPGQIVLGQNMLQESFSRTAIKVERSQYLLHLFRV